MNKLKNIIFFLGILFIILGCSENESSQNTAPKIENQSFSIQENIDSTTIIGIILATDADNDALTYSITTNDNDFFTINQEGNLYLFTGKMLDFDSAQLHTITVSVSDGKLTTSAIITIYVIETPNNNDLSDSFDGNGPLLNYTINNESVLPDVARKDGKYRANLVDNDDNKTLHYNNDQGRLDAKKIKFPFEFIGRNIGIGTQQDSQVAPSSNGDAYIFCGIQVHVLDLEQTNSSHVVVGHRGNATFTIEGKNTLNGSSAVNDIGANTIPDGRADIRIVGNQDNTLTIYWQLPNLSLNPQSDSWVLYNGTGKLPGQEPIYSNEVYIGLITYAFYSTGLPFVGTCDAIEGMEL